MSEYEELLERLDADHSVPLPGLRWDAATQLRTQAGRIKELEQPWISADERLPGLAEWVLQTDGKRMWVYPGSGVAHKDITHWMPLPGPPGEGGGG